MEEGGMRLPTRAVSALELPSFLAEQMDRPVLVMRARRGGRGRFGRAIARLGERAVRILDADGYLLVVVADEDEQRSIMKDLAGEGADMDVTGWDRRGDPVTIDERRD